MPEGRSSAREDRVAVNTSYKRNKLLQENGHCAAFLFLRVAAAVNFRSRMFIEPFWLEKTLHVSFTQLLSRKVHFIWLLYNNLEL